jgi:polygalacturonase
MPQKDGKYGRHGKRFSRRALIAATGGGLVAGCLGNESGNTPAPTTDVSGDTETSTPSATETAASNGGEVPIDGVILTGTEGGNTQVDVTEYGAAPDEKSDDTEAIRDAFRAAAIDGATVTFPEGTYRVHSERPGYYTDGEVPLDHPVFILKGYRNLTVEGNGSKLSLRGRLVDGKRHFAMTFNLRHLRNATLRGLTIDWDRDIPHTAGVVVEETPDHFDLEVNDPFTPREGLKNIRSIRYVQDTGHITGALYRGGGLCEPVSESVLRVPKGQEWGDDVLETGWGMRVRHARAAAQAIRAENCGGLTVQDVTIHSLPGMAINVTGGRDLTFDGVSIVPASDQHWLSSCRDGFHLGDVAGSLTIKDAEVVLTGDDAFNLKMGRSTVDVVDETTIEWSGPQLWTWYRAQTYESGKTVAIGASPSPFEVAATRTIAAFEKSAPEEPRVTTGTYRLTVDEPLPASIVDAETVSIYNQSNVPQDALIENTTIRDIRGGCRFMIPNLTVRNTEWIRGGQVLWETNPVEGIPAKNIVFENNTMRNYPDSGGGGGGYITPWIHGHPTEDIPSDTYNDHTYRNNTFRQLRRENFPAINLRDIANVTIEGNDFAGVRATPPVQFGSNVDCETVRVNGQTGCSFSSATVLNPHPGDTSRSALQAFHTVRRR